MSNKLKFPAIFVALVLGIFLMVFLVSCSKTAVPTQIYGTYIGTSTNSGLVSGSIADTFIISAHSSAADDSVNVFEKVYSVTLVGTVSSNDDTLYIPSQPVTYAGKACIFTGTTGSVAVPDITLSILETSTTGTTLGTLVFEGTD